jgi:hypothetical protein
MAGFGTASNTVDQAPHRLAARIAWTWFMVGLVAWSAMPALRGYSPQIGWLSYWLVGAPLLVLVTIHRQVLAAWARSILVGSRPGPGGAVVAGSQWDGRQGRRRRANRHVQARRVAPPRRSIVRTLSAALFS